MSDSDDARERFGPYVDMRETSPGAILIRQHCYDLAMTLEENLANCRERSLAMTKLEECLLWALQALDKFGDM